MAKSVHCNGPQLFADGFEDSSRYFRAAAFDVADHPTQTLSIRFESGFLPEGLTKNGSPQIVCSLLSCFRGTDL